MPENLPAQLISVKQETESFINDFLKPLEEDISEDGVIPDEIKTKVREASRARGLFFKTQPKDFGGDPAGALELTMLRELFASANLRLGALVFGPGPGVLHAATGELKKNYLDPVVRGEKRGAFGFTEPDSAERPTWARREDDELVVTGQKSYVTGGDTADFVSVLLNVEKGTDGEGGTAMVVIDRDLPGVVIDRKFSSLDGSGHVSMRFDEARVPIANVIGKIGEGMPQALGNIGNVRLSVSAQATGICMWAIDFVTGYISSPHRSGTPLGDREGVRLRYADMRIETYAARSMLYRTARLIDQGDRAINETIATKVFCTETAGRVVDMAVQLVGGQALVKGHPLEKLYRQVRSFRFVEGASDLLRINLAKGRLELDQGRL